MLEKTYWAQRGVSWLLITPNQYDANVSLTLRRTSPWGYADPASQAEIDIACQVVRSEPWLPFSDVIQSITSHLGGGNHIYSAQRALWQAVWRGFLPIDLRRSWRPHHPLASVSREIFFFFQSHLGTEVCMHLIHNQVYKLTTDANGLAAGIYRIIADDIRTDTTYCVQIKSESTHARPKGGRPRIGALKPDKALYVHSFSRILIQSAPQRSSRAYS